MAKLGGDELRLRIRVNAPPSGVVFQVQRGATELEPAIRTAKGALIFEFPVRLSKQPDGKPNFLGPYTQGPPAARFVYVNSGTLAGQPDSCWTRRAKVPLTSITWTLIDEARALASLLEIEINGTGRDGGPTCGSLRLSSGWRVSRPGGGERNS